MPLTRTARDRVATGFVDPDVRAGQGRTEGNHAWLRWGDEACGRAPWDLAPAEVTGRQGTAARSPQRRSAPGTPGADLRNLREGGRNGGRGRRHRARRVEQAQSNSSTPIPTQATAFHHLTAHGPYDAYSSKRRDNGRGTSRSPAPPVARSHPLHPAPPNQRRNPPTPPSRHRRCPDVGADQVGPRGAVPRGPTPALESPSETPSQSAVSQRSPSPASPAAPR